jgi:hypothetical protein
MSGRNIQQEVLKKLLTKTRNTDFGNRYSFKDLLKSENLINSFQSKVPIHSYNEIFEHWWSKCLNGQRNVIWPGRLRYFALSSGTSESRSKFIPISKDTIKASKRIMLKLLISLWFRKHKATNLFKSWLMLGGCTTLIKERDFLTGDLTGILAQKIPLFFQPFYKPGRTLAKLDWEAKIHEIVKKAPLWDIGFIVGMPSWVQLCLDTIIKHHKLKHIHEIWPNFNYYISGGISFDLYNAGFKKLLGKPITIINSYLASEGYIALDTELEGELKLLTRQIFFEFIEFNERNFDNEGNVRSDLKIIILDDIETNKDYAILITNNSGAWRYLLGDTIRFTDTKRFTLIVSGRTRHFLNIVGEHLSVENMDRAIEKVNRALSIKILEYSVHPVSDGCYCTHHWYIGCDCNVEITILEDLLDNNLRKCNDDYDFERNHLLKKLKAKVISSTVFIDFLKTKKKIGGQSKFPRVLKGELLQEWQAYLNTV